MYYNSLSLIHKKGKDEKDLGEEEKRQLDKLKNTDQEVRAHERAHMAAGSGLVKGGASYEYERGPDGKMYAVGGEVKIDTSKEGDDQQPVSHASAGTNPFKASDITFKIGHNLNIVI